MALRAPARGTFEDRLREVRVEASRLLRLSRFPATEPYWSTGRYRFDGPPAGTPGSFGTCYAAEDLSVAFAESVIHEAALFVNGTWLVPRAELDARQVVRLHRPSKPALVLADLTGAGLKALGLNNDVCAGDDYTEPMMWAQAIHEADTKWDGIRYVSRQRNSGFAVALFERSGVQKKSARGLGGKVLGQLLAEYEVAVI